MTTPLSFVSSLPARLIETAQTVGLLPTGPPERIIAGARQVPVHHFSWQQTIDDVVRNGEVSMGAAYSGSAYVGLTLRQFDQSGNALSAPELICVHIQSTYQPATGRDLLTSVAALDFSTGVCGQLDRMWRGRSYRGTGLLDYHLPNGFACFFQGEGHKRLVSPRWLDYGPWRVLRGPSDTTMVQFHDVAADPATALEQAKPGHERMGASYKGGFLWPTMTFRILKSWLYDRDSKKVTVLVNRREVEPGELLEAATMRAFQTLGPDQPIERAAYVFVHPDEAQQHLHELWLRELECWTFTPKGQEIRLDLDYQPPPPVKPDWVQQVEAREAG